MTFSIGAPLPHDFLMCQVKDQNGDSHALSQLLANQPTLLLFVRHFGCIGCSENTQLLAPRFEELQSVGIQVIIIGCGPPMFIEGFRERQHLLFSPAAVYTDETLSIQRAADLMYGAWGGFRPRALFEMARAFMNGHVAGPHEGDVKQQAGAIVVDQRGVVHLYHRNESLGDHVSGSTIVDVALKMHLQNHPGII